MASIITLADAKDWLGITGGTDDSRLTNLLDAISAEMRRIARRDYEGSATIYDEVVRVNEFREIVLRRAPLDSVIALRTVDFDGTESGVLTPRDVVGGLATTLAAAAAIGATNLRLTTMVGAAVGDHVRVGSGDTMEVVRVKTVGTAGGGGTGADIEPALRYAQVIAAIVVEVSGSEEWRVESLIRGAIRILEITDYLRATYRVTGLIPDDVEQAAREWMRDRWDSRAAVAALKRYRTGDDEEEYFEALAGWPPRNVLRVLLGNHHAVGGGVV